MTRTQKYRKKKPGLSPGSLVLVGEQKVDTVKITLFDYDQEHIEEKIVSNVEDCFSYRNNNRNTWINVDGLHDTEVIRKLGDLFSIHPLSQEDILDTANRPKIDDLDHYIFVSLKMLQLDSKSNKLIQEQISIIFGERFVVSFQEAEGDVFNPIRERLRLGKGRMRKMGADYFAYTLMDSIVDNYFVIIERLGERIEDLDEEIINKLSKKTLPRIHDLKGQLIQVRKAVWPLRDIVSNLDRTESELIKDGTSIFLKDLYDHSVQVIDTVETYRDLTSGLFDMYLTTINNRTNDIMKVLTMMATIFIPLTFIVGVYGMNFHYLPELDWHYGYHFVWALMIAIALGILGFFRKKGWM